MTYRVTFRHIETHTTPTILTVHLRVGYVRFPQVPETNRGKNDSLADRLAGRYAVHLQMSRYGENAKDRMVAAHHWHPSVLETSEGRKFPNFVSKKMGKDIGLTDADKAGSPWATDVDDDSRHYFNVPNMSMQRAMACYEEEKNQSIIAAHEDAAFTPSAAATVCQSSIKSCSRSSSVSIRAKRHVADLEVRAAADASRRAVERQQKELDARANKMAELALLNPALKEWFEKDWRERDKRAANLEAELDEANEALSTLRTQRDLESQSFQYSSEADIKAVVAEHCGSCGMNLTNLEWHEKNKNACKDLFGFNTFDEMNTLITKVLWPNQFASDPLLYKNATGHVTEYAKCLICKMRFHRKISIQCLASIWGRRIGSISGYVRKWALMWGRAGLNFSILDIPPDFLQLAMPQEFKDSNLMKVGALVDGKVFMTEESRKHSAIKNAMYNDKTHHAGVLLLTWILPYGLTFEHTHLFCGRCTEGAAVQQWGAPTP